MKPELLQSYLFRQSLIEIERETLFRFDHKQGYNYINNRQYEIKYPKSYIDHIDKISKDKEYNYCFIGYVGKLGRGELIRKFNSETSIIKDSANGRNIDTKYNFDLEYYQTLSKTRFSLCPNHIGDWYIHDRAWTYRYIESLFCKTIPIVFRKTPLGKDFLKDTFFLWDDESHNISNTEYNDIVEKNYQKSLNYWTFVNNGIDNV
jgi:hypothetical protein